MKRSLQFDALEGRDLQSLFTSAVAPVAGATQTGAGVASVSAALAAHAIADQAGNHTDALPNPMDPVDGSVHGQGVLPSPIDPAQGGIPKFHGASF